MTTSREYRQFARRCTKWAAEAKTDDARNDFLNLAFDWTLAALHAGHAPQEAPPPKALAA
jgi:hypothetical protein